MLTLGCSGEKEYHIIDGVKLSLPCWVLDSWGQLELVAFGLGCYALIEWEGLEKCIIAL